MTIAKLTRLPIATTVALTLATLGLGGCDVDQTQETKLPKVSVEGGQMPKFDVEVADVDVATEKRELTVPDVDVSGKKMEVTVPDVDLNSKSVEVTVPTGIEVRMPPDDGNNRVDD